jgi:hypothetical protein
MLARWKKMSGEFQSQLATEVSATPDDRTTKLGINILSTEYSVMSCDAQTLAQKAVLNVNPDGTEAGIWLSDTGPAVDAEGNLYVPTGNGLFDAVSGGHDYSDSVVKLDGSSLAIRDYFTPHDQDRISNADSDVGSSGPLLMPRQAGPHRHLLLQPTNDIHNLCDRSRQRQIPSRP